MTSCGPSDSESCSSIERVELVRARATHTRGESLPTHIYFSTYIFLQPSIIYSVHFPFNYSTGWPFSRFIISIKLATVTQWVNLTLCSTIFPLIIDETMEKKNFAILTRSFPMRHLGNLSFSRLRSVCIRFLKTRENLDATGSQHSSVGQHFCVHYGTCTYSRVLPSAYVIFDE